MNSTFVKIVPVEITVPMEYIPIYQIATKLLGPVSAKLMECRDDDLSLTQTFLQMLVRFILDTELTPERKWLAVCSIVDQYIGEWPKMVSSIRREDRRDFQRMFGEFGKMMDKKVK